MEARECSSMIKKSPNRVSRDAGRAFREPAEDGLRSYLWELIQEPGAYVELSTGDLFRISKDALVPRASPVIIRESLTPALMLRISDNPMIRAEDARLLCARHNIQPNF
jgi:hypothetical protein